MNIGHPRCAYHVRPRHNPVPEPEYLRLGPAIRTVSVEPLALPVPTAPTIVEVHVTELEPVHELVPA